MFANNDRWCIKISQVGNEEPFREIDKPDLNTSKPLRSELSKTFSTYTWTRNGGMTNCMGSKTL